MEKKSNPMCVLQEGSAQDARCINSAALRNRGISASVGLEGPTIFALISLLSPLDQMHQTQIHVCISRVRRCL